MAQPDPSIENLFPVILGGDVGAYTMGLEMFEAYGLRSLCVASSPIDMITESVIFDVATIPPHATDEMLLEQLLAVKRDNPGKTLLLLTNRDGNVTFVVNNKDVLGAEYLLPYPSARTVEEVADKVSFAQLAESVGVPTPKTVVVDFSDAHEGGWQAPQVDLEYPVVAKAAKGSAYEPLIFPGKKKIWFIDTPAELDALWATLREAGFDDVFLVQENIPGDDTAMRSLTFYVDSEGDVTLRSSARVLLQDPSPTMIGNPVAMITDDLEELSEMGERILKASNYKGFANFDVKVDPRNGTPYFLEVNPRIGRNSYYVLAAGANPMVPMVNDLYFGRKESLKAAVNKSLYSLVPLGLIKKYVKEKALVEEAVSLAKAGRMVDPLASKHETSLKRKATAALQRLNYYRKFKAHWQFG